MILDRNIHVFVVSGSYTLIKGKIVLAYGIKVTEFAFITIYLVGGIIIVKLHL